MLLGESRESLCGRDGALTENPRFQTGQIDDGRRSTGQLAAVQRGSDPSADLGRHLVETPRIRVAVEVGAGRCDHADPAQELGGDAAQFRNADADRVGTRSAQPRKPPGRIREYESEGTAPEARR